MNLYSALRAGFPADLDATAAAVRDLRLRLAGAAGEGPIPPSLRPGVATGIVDLDERAHELAGAARQGVGAGMAEGYETCRFVSRG